MVFHRFRQLPAELRLQIWECALNEAHIIDDILTDNQMPICRMIKPRGLPKSPVPRIKLITLEYFSLGHVCHESREVLRQRGRLYKARDYNPSTDVVYVDDYFALLLMLHQPRSKIRHVAFPADFFYVMLTEDVMRRRDSKQVSTLRDTALGRIFLNNNGDHFYTGLGLPELESITVVLPPLEKSMPYYADHFPVAMRPSFLRLVPYSEVQRIKIQGPYAYRSWLRGSVNTKRQFLGPFIKDINEIWKVEASFRLNDDDKRQEITVQAGVLQYLEVPLQGKMRLSPIYKEGKGFEETQAADQDSGCTWAFHGTCSPTDTL
ncbi:hypothetical protein KVR01_000632 [Diaporthe batatas]|uniref:uncharacterized protein n=1 Tax=Diaporthe batatas TaxID=748121 RepID=UPI001D0567AF|nr:uncharacterized protein KVR01_000632 [Diaporthe batatas]KAG8169887.1 hypothetical protein KVR01_000632 [Diaporthe batatas]